MTAATLLNGIRIIDLSMGWAGPLACRHMADMGADVIKVESCERFDWWRSWEATQEWIESNGAEKSTAFNTVNRNKRDITLDLEHPEGRTLLLDLVKTANIVVENYSGSVLPKLDLSFEIFRKAKPDIILLSMPAFGSTGPWSNFRAYGSTVEQSSGLPHLNGSEDDLPTMQHVALGDAVGGLTGAAAILVALRHQSRTGEGQFVDLSQVEGLFPMASHGILEYAATGNSPERTGSRFGNSLVRGVYACKGEDQWVAIECSSEDHWSALTDEIGKALAEFGDYATAKHRVDEIDSVLSDSFRDKEAKEVMRQLQSIGIPAAAALTTVDILNDPHLAQRGFWQFQERAFVGLQPHPSPPYRVGKEPISIASAAPTLGEHNEEILKTVLGLEDEDVSRLETLGVIGNRPRMPSK